MNTRQIRLTLLGLAFGILLALLISPQTRWLVRTQTLSSPLTPRSDEARKRQFVQRHPADYQVQLAGQVDSAPQTALEYDRVLVSRFPESASLRAIILRDAMVKEVRMHRDEDYLISGQSVPPYHADPQNPPPTPAQLAAFDADAASGERLDPDNAYFPLMRSVGLFAAHQDSAGLAAVQRAAIKPQWREYDEDEVEGRWRINDAVYGGREAISATAVAASALFPHYAELRSVARVVAYKAILDEQAGHPEAGLKLRNALGRCGELMSVQSTTIIGNLVGGAINTISRGRPGGAPSESVGRNLTGDQQMQKRLALYCTYVTKIGHPEAVAQAQSDTKTWQQIHQILSKLDSHMLGNKMADFISLIVALLTGWIIFPNVLSLFVLGLIAAGLSRLPQVRAHQPLPAGVTTGLWVTVLIGFLIILIFFDAGPADFPTYVPLLISLPLLSTALIALMLPRLRRPILTAVVTAGAILGVGWLLSVLAAWQTHGGAGVLATVQEMVSMSGPDSNPGALVWNNPHLQVLIGEMLALAVPLLLALILSLVSRVRHVPVSVGLVEGFRAAMPPLVFVLMLVYGGLVLWTVRQEAKVNYGLERSLHGEGQYLAQMTGEVWPTR